MTLSSNMKVFNRLVGSVKKLFFFSFSFKLVYPITLYAVIDYIFLHKNNSEMLGL